MEEFETLNRISRRQYSADFKAQVLSECAQPGVRVAEMFAVGVRPAEDDWLFSVALN